MKKKRFLIALVVLLGAGACGLPWWEDLLLAVAYGPAEQSDEYLVDVDYPKNSPFRGWHSFSIRKKRISWLPGPPFSVLDSTCVECSEGACGSCSQEWHAVALRNPGEFPVVKLGGWTATGPLSAVSYSFGKIGRGRVELFYHSILTTGRCTCRACK